MPRTLLIAHPDANWREWLRDHLGKRDLVFLDPSQPEHGPPGRLVWVKEGKVKGWSFLGTLEVQRSPIPWFAGATQLVAEAGPDCVILTFPWRRTPLIRQLLFHFAQAIQPEEILVPKGLAIASEGWPVGAEEVELPKGLLPMVIDASRRANWLEMVEQSDDHEVNLLDVTLVGARLGSGERVVVGEPGDYAEVSGGVLLLITEREVTDLEVGSLLNATHTRKVVHLRAKDYAGLVCSFADQQGVDFGMGRIESFDPAAGVFQIRCQAVAPAPVRLLKLGLIRIDRFGKESFPLEPWTV